MADVSKLRLDNITYDIKDDNARKYLVMVNEEPVSATKVVIETGEEDGVELAYQEDVDNLQNDVDVLQDNVLTPYLFVPHLEADHDPAGNCFAFIFKNRCTLIDLGRYSYNGFTTIETQLKAKGVDTIDNIIITHWHGDHDSMRYDVDPDKAYDHWKNSFDCSKTKLYIPREAPEGFDADNGYAAVNASFESSNISILSNSTTFVWEGIAFSVKNQSDDDYAYYVASGSTDLNNCSAIVYAEYNGFVFLDTGDILPVSQTRCVAEDYIKTANILSIPHHGVNGSIYRSFMARIKPQHTYIANSVPALQYGNRDGNIWQAGLTGALYDNVNNKNGVEFYFNQGVIAKGTPTINSGYNVATHYRVMYVSENVQSGDAQDGTQEHPYKNIAYVCSLCKGVTNIQLLSDITTQAQFNEMSGSVWINGNGHSLNGINARFHAEIYLDNVVLTGPSFIDQAFVRFQSCTFASTMEVYRSFINANNSILNNAQFANNLSYSFVTINEIGGTTGTFNYIIEIPYFSTITISANTTGKNIQISNLNCLINDHTGFNTKYVMDNVRENLAASVNVTKFTKSFTLTNGSAYLLIASHSSGGVAVHAITTYGNAIQIANVSASSFVHLTTSGLNLTVTADWPIVVSLTKLT